MKRISLVVLCLALAAITAEAAIQCTPDICTKLTCTGEQTREQCLARGPGGQYKFVERGGACGCCHNCLTILSKFYFMLEKIIPENL